MGNLVIPERLKSYLASTSPDGTDAEKRAHSLAVIKSKWEQYDVRKRVSDKIEGGEYSLTGNTTLQSVMGKENAESIELFDSYVNQEFLLCVTEDNDLG